MNHFAKNFFEGILLLDKPYGISSNNALQIVKKIYKAKRAGYVGTLDPIATGMLPICFGQYTKFSQFLLDTNKNYYVVAKLGQKTDTFDKTGLVIEKKKISFNKTLLHQSINSFLGSISQKPPIYSAIKYNGIPLYKYIRRNMKLPIIKNKNVIVYNIKIIYIKKKEIALNIICSKGTYIRSIINDLGDKLGCGAHVTELRRLQLAEYKTEKMITINYLNDLVKRYNTINFEKFFAKKLAPLFMPINKLLYFLPKIHLTKKLLILLKNGVSIQIDNKSFLFNSLVQITEENTNNFIGIGQVFSNGRIAPIRLII